MSLIDDIESRSKMFEDGLLFENEDARRLLGICKALAADAAGSKMQTWRKVVAIRAALNFNSLHQLDLALDPPKQELK